MPDALSEPAPNLWSQSCPDRLAIPAGQVHVFRTCLDCGTAALAKFERLLSQEESERAARFRFEAHRNRFIAGRARLRQVLSRCAGLDPREIELAYSIEGKPRLAASMPRTGLQFNLAHSNELALIAVTHNARIGIDLEFVRPLSDMDALVSRFFSKRESALFQELAEPEKPAAFFNLWTRKEALLKATGAGIAGGLDKVEVTFLRGERPEFLSLPGGREAIRNWCLRQLDPGADCAAAVAVECPDRDCLLTTWELGGEGGVAVSDIPAAS